MKHRVLLYLATLVIMIALDCFWFTFIAQDFYKNRIDIPLEFRALPAALFYLMYAAGITVFANGLGQPNMQSALRCGALFGFFAYATYDLTNMATLRGWSWQVVAVDVAWGTFNTAVSAGSGWRIARVFSRN